MGLLLFFAALLVSALVWPGQSSPLGVICHRPDLLNEAHWSALEQLGATCEFLVIPTVTSPDQPFDFTQFEADLTASASHKLDVAASPVPHLGSVFWQPQTDPDGNTKADRQNPYDPAFRAEWARFHLAFCERYGHDPRLKRIYVNPPSFYGETEYYLGSDWNNPVFFCYGPLARQRYTEWRQRTFGSSESAESLSLPKPSTRTAPGEQVDAGWLEFMQWRREYLLELMSEQLHLLGNRFDGETCFKYSVGIFSAFQGTDASALASRCRDLPRLGIHCTNGHSLADLKLAVNLRDTYGLSSLVTENDGNRYGRTELARIALNCLLAGVHEFNFAHMGYLAESTGAGGATNDTVRTLLQMRQLLKRYPTAVPRKGLAFLHTVSSSYARAPLYRNADVPHVYDSALSNGSFADSWGFNWARWLEQPDVTDEQLVLDGDLAGRKLLILPSTDTTLVRAEAWQQVEEWVQTGGVVAGFGPDSSSATLPSAGKQQAPSTSLVKGVFPKVGESIGELQATRQLLEWLAGPPWELRQGACPVWEGPLPSGWEPLVEDSEGHCALAQHRLEEGRLVWFPALVPVARGGPYELFYAETVPLLLRALAEASNCEFRLRLTDAEGALVAPLSIGYAGEDALTGRHLFVAGAYEGAPSSFEFHTAPGLEGPSQLLLVDTQFAEVSPLAESCDARVVERPPGQAAVYSNPAYADQASTSLLPCVRIEFTAPASFEVRLAPEG